MADILPEKAASTTTESNSQKKPDIYSLRKQPNGSIFLYNQEGKLAFGYEKGELDKKLPSGKTINIFSDSRISGQAEYSEFGKGFVFSPQTIKEIENPNGTTDGFRNNEQKTKYFLKHEYTHMIWDQIDNSSKDQILQIFEKTEYIDAVKAFGSHLVSKKEYQVKQVKELNVDCFEFKVGNEIQRFEKAWVVNELLAHAVLGELMTDQDIKNIQVKQPQYENFVNRSTAALDCLRKIQRTSLSDFSTLSKSGVVRNTDFEKDYPVLKSLAAFVKS